MLDRYSDMVVDETIPEDGGAEAVAAPDPVFGSLDVIADERVAAESRLDSICRGEAEVVAVEKIVVGAALAGVHSALAGPQKNAVAAVGHRVVGDDVLVALLVDQQVRGVLPAPIKPFAVAAHVVIGAVVHDGVAARPVETYADAGVEREVVVPDAEPAASHQHQSIHSLVDGVAGDLTGCNIAQVRSRAVAEPLPFFIVVEREPVDETFVLDDAIKPGLPVVAQVVVDQ